MTASTIESTKALRRTPPPIPSSDSVESRIRRSHYGRAPDNHIAAPDAPGLMPYFHKQDDTFILFKRELRRISFPQFLGRGPDKRD
jgi:hypothetical protein